MAADTLALADAPRPRHLPPARRLARRRGRPARRAGGARARADAPPRRHVGGQRRLRAREDPVVGVRAAAAHARGLARRAAARSRLRGVLREPPRARLRQAGHALQRAPAGARRLPSASRAPRAFTTCAAGSAGSRCPCTSSPAPTTSCSRAGSQEELAAEIPGAQLTVIRARLARASTSSSRGVQRRRARFIAARGDRV